MRPCLWHVFTCVSCAQRRLQKAWGGFFPHVIGREEAIFHTAWAGNICLASKTHNDIHTRTHRSLLSGTARAPLKYLSPAVLGCCVCQPNVCWYPSHYAKCIICHVVGRCLVCGPVDNSQTLQMNVSHNTHGHRAPLPLLLVIPLPHSLPNLLTHPLTDSPPPFFSFTHTHALSKLIHWHFQSPSLSHTLSITRLLSPKLTSTLSRFFVPSQMHIHLYLRTRVGGFLWLLELTQTLVKWHMFSAVAWFISTENKSWY